VSEFTRAEVRWETVRQLAGIPEEKWSLLTRKERREVERRLRRAGVTIR
jgi:hypothetical protein